MKLANKISNISLFLRSFPQFAEYVMEVTTKEYELLANTIDIISKTFSQDAEMKKQYFQVFYMYDMGCFESC